MTNPLTDFDFITVIDDDAETAEVVRDLLVDLGRNLTVDLITDGPYDAPEQLLERIKRNNGRQGVVCDHRLQHQGLAAFYGSELLAMCYNERIPGVLVTQFSEVDADTSIREYRRWLPTMLNRETIDSQALLNGLATCRREFAGDLLVNRQAHRTLVNVVSTTKEGGELVADAFIPGWNPRHAIRFPLKSLTEIARDSLLQTVEQHKEAYAFAMVNVGAKDSSELFLYDFEPAIMPGKSLLDSIIASAA